MSQAKSTKPPPGYDYLPNLLSEAEELALIRYVQTLSFVEVRMRGMVARRRTAHFGWLYGYDSWQITPGPPIPPHFEWLRERAAALINVLPGKIEEVLVTDYPPGAGIGWHRDAPQFGPAVIGISLLSPARFRFQRRTSSGREVAESLLAPRSAYVLSGEARTAWQHSIPGGKRQRYSLTFRTLAG